ncbi:unnamed protein product [Rhodiola kirilowii]
MESTSAGSYSDCNKKFEYQVFLNFRGTDTRTFMGHLFNALKQTGFRVFLDNDGLEHGKDIQQKLYEAIHRSEMSVVILSGGYADSRWCLDELVKIMELQALNVHHVLPVFFDVEPTVVRNQTGVYKNAFSKLEELYKGEKERVEKWKSALKRVADLKGLSLNAHRDESLLVEKIIQELRKIVNTNRLYVPPYIVGREFILKNINMWLRDGSPDVEVGLIYGLGGIGKSTIAKIAYNYNSHLFDGCSFLADFTRRKTTQFDGLACLLEQVILDFTGKSGTKIHNVDKGINDVGALLCSRRVLVVLDDVDGLKHLPNAFDDPDFFGKGSKIIITTRNEELRNVKLFKRKFEVNGLNFQESEELLKVHAFITKDPLSQRQEEILNEFMIHCQGLPQALIVMGPLLRNKTEEMWENLLTELKEYPDHEIFNVFKLSFDCIDDKCTKDLFLYIACFFIEMDKEYSLKILGSCKFRPISGIEELVNRHLLTIGYDGKLIMHQSIEEMGKEIARQEAISEPERRSKLWSATDSLAVLENVKGTSIIRGLRLYLQKPANHTSPEPKRICLGLKYWNPWRKVSTLNLMYIRTSSFTMMSNLELLLLNHVQLEGGYEDFPKKIKWLLWPGCPLQSIPSNFNLDELVVLDMQKSYLVHAWKACKYVGALRILNLSYSDRLVCTPDLSCALMLEWLYLEGCTSLEKVHKSIGNLSNLSCLNLKGCTSLVKIHRSIKTLKKLTMLNLSGCESLEGFPIPSSVVQLNLYGCRRFFMACNQMQSSVVSPSSLNTILSAASSLLQYPIPSTSPYLPFNLCLPALTKLNLRGCGITRADVMGLLLSCAPSLKTLDLCDNPIHVFSYRDMRPNLKLRQLYLRGCTELRSISNLPRNCILFVEGCSSLKRISYNYDSTGYIPSIVARGCYELVEIDSRRNDRLVIKWIDELDESEANQLGFPNLHAAASESILLDNEEICDHIGRGFYQAGTYQFYLLGDHLAKWFTVTARAAELCFTVPSSQLDIRALNLGFIVSAKRGLNVYDVKIKNLTSMWQWSTSSVIRLDRDSSEVTVTWLSHWRTVEEHREIKPGDLLHISLNEFGHPKIVTWGIKIIYEEDQQQQVDEAGPEQHDENRSSRSQTVNSIDKTITSSIDGKRADQEEEENGSTSVSNYRYNNIFLSSLDLSVYEYERDSDDDEDLNNKLRKFNIFGKLFTY